jgi:methylase of polypeptide subunit release factors
MSRVTSPMPLWSAAHRLIRGASGTVRSSSLVAKWLFHANVVNRSHDDLWDATTVVLRKALLKFVHDGQRVLDLGTGHIGVLAIFCASIRQVDVTAVDVNKSFLENAAQVAAASAVPPIRFLQSDWFSNVEGPFDVIFGNIPYIPTAARTHLDDVTTFTEVWDGGRDGLAHAVRILSDCRSFLSDGGRLLLGINTLYVPRSATLALIRETPGLRVVNIVTSRLSPSDVYVISPAS